MAYNFGPAMSVVQVFSQLRWFQICAGEKKSLQSFCRRRKAVLLWRLSFRMVSFAKDKLQPLVHKISIKTLEKCYLQC